MKKSLISEILGSAISDLRESKPILEDSKRLTAVEGLFIDFTQGTIRGEGFYHLGREQQGRFSSSVNVDFQIDRNIPQTWRDGTDLDLYADLKSMFGWDRKPTFIEAVMIGHRPFSFFLRADFSTKPSPADKQVALFLVAQRARLSAKEKRELIKNLDDFAAYPFYQVHGMTPKWFRKHGQFMIGDSPIEFMQLFCRLVDDVVAVDVEAEALVDKERVSCDTCMQAGCCRAVAGVPITNADANRLAKSFTHADGTPLKTLDLLTKGIVTRRVSDDPRNETGAALPDGVFGYLAFDGEDAMRGCKLLVKDPITKLPRCSVWKNRPTICRQFQAPNGFDCSTHDNNLEHAFRKVLQKSKIGSVPALPSGVSLHESVLQPWMPRPQTTGKRGRSLPVLP